MTSIKASIEQQFNDPKRMLEIARACSFDDVIAQLDDLAQRKKANAPEKGFALLLNLSFAWRSREKGLATASAAFMGRLLEIAHENIEAGNTEQGIEQLLTARKYNTQHFHNEASEDYISRRLQETGYSVPGPAPKP